MKRISTNTLKIKRKLDRTMATTTMLLRRTARSLAVLCKHEKEKPNPQKQRVLSHTLFFCQLAKIPPTTQG